MDSKEIKILLLRAEWSRKQYDKIQDFVIYNHLWENQPKNKSHADIVIDLAKEALDKRKE